MNKYLGILLVVLSFILSGALRKVSQQHIIDENLLQNPGFENGLAKWTKSGASTLAKETANPLFGATSAIWDASATGETFSANPITITEGIKGRDCIVSVQYKWATGTSGDVKLQAKSGANVLVEIDLVKSTTAIEAFAAFTCPTSGTITPVLESTANAAAITADNFYIGKNYKLVDVSQAEEVGHLRWQSTNCIWQNSSDGAWLSFPVDADCTVLSSRGKAVEPATKIPAVKIPSVQPGIYQVVVNGNMSVGSATLGDWCSFVITDGTTKSASTSTRVLVTSQVAHMQQIIGTFKYDVAQGDKTFEIIYSNTTSTTCGVRASDYQSNEALEISVYRYPLNSQKAVSLDTQGWYVDANIGGGSPSLGIISQSSYVEITHATLDLVKNVGSQPVGIACSSTNSSAPGDLTCSSGNESIGIVFDISRVGVYKIAVDFGSSINGANGQLTYQLVETLNSTQTILQEGGSRVNLGNGNTASTVFPTHIEGVFKFNSIGKKTIRLMYEQDLTAATANAIVADRNAGVGQRDIHFTVYPITQNFPQAVAITDINPTYMSDSAATKAGYKQYLCDVAAGPNDIAYNGGVKATVAYSAGGGSISGANICILKPYQTQNGDWWLKFILEVASSAASRSYLTISINGILNYVPSNQPIGGNAAVGGAQFTQGYTIKNTNTFLIGTANSVTAGAYRYFGDIKLDSKPTWAY